MEVNSRCGSNLPKVIWTVEILDAVDDSKPQSEGVNGQVTKVTWRIENFSRINNKEICSQHFTVDGNKWQISIFPKGNNVDALSIYLGVADSATLPSGWSRFAQYGFAVIDQMDRRNSFTKVATHVFNATSDNWGFPSFFALCELNDPKRGYLVNDACLVEAYISTDRTPGLISKEFMLKTDSAKHKTVEADHVKETIDNQTTAKTEPVEITTPSPTQPCQNVESQAVEPTEEDVETFFTSLESELSSHDTVFSKEEAKEALAKLDEALSMTPVNLYHSGKFFFHLRRLSRS
ncbi:MATH domain and coiled-coil domain-containing protein At3g58340-like [Hibiscus syriacus]|uniref:MATH domain and coiled-coil domain-containing protein At3g58340-like n=1 Tax=Hibiscus syriacus TaxID=106335 RepID=UPI0019244FCD|nr:MATH domain and coiled-coil domain-containing protein At3g58340-like [Hibiscus syriacus]